MKKEVITLFLLGILLVSPLILAQEQTQIYSGFNRFTGNVEMFFASSDNKVMLALEIREKEVDSAISNSQNQNEKGAIKNLEGAHKKLQFVREKISLDVVDEVKESVEEVINKIEDEENLSDNFDVYVLEEKKTQLTAELTEKTFEYCKELAKEDFALMLEEEECNPDTAIPGLEKELEELEDIQMKLFVELMLEIRSCIDDPGTCNCKANVDVEQKAKCEKMVALAVRCEYTDDEMACDELKAMKPVKGDNFAISFVPEFLRNLFREKDYMIEYDIEPSDCVPEECWDENDKPECRQYDSFKETKDDWDEYGNFIGTENKCGTKGQVPTMRESIPECFDGDIFLEEKCGKITMVENEDGLINYLIGKEIDNIIDDFENRSRQYAPGTYANGTIEGNKSVRGEEVWEIKEGINTIDNEITKWVINHSVMDVDGDGGLTWDIKTDKDGGDNGNVVVVGNGDDDTVDPGPQGIVGSDGSNGNVVVGGDNGNIAPGIIDTDTELGPVTNQIDGGTGTNQIDNGATLDNNDASDDSVLSSDSVSSEPEVVDED